MKAHKVFAANKRKLASARSLALAVSVALSGFCGVVNAAKPVQVKDVVQGSASIQQRGNYTTITVANGTVIDYTRFNILAGQTVQFIEPSSGSRALNQIDSGTPSIIAGTLTANGAIYFVNPSGIVFTSSAKVDVSRLYAIAGAMNIADFNNGADHFAGTGPVINRGSISADAAFLVGQEVANFGAINTPNGTVAIAAGDDVLIGSQSGGIYLKIVNAAAIASSASSSPAAPAQGAAAASVHGTALFTAGDIYGVALKRSSSVTAANVVVQSGSGGTTSVSGTIDASDKPPGGVGGAVHVLGGNVSVTNATIDASGDAGGGSILVGGDYKGQGTVPNAKYTLVDSATTLNADAIATGNGGKVIVWADNATAYYGSLTARGGSQSGNGGMAEVSGKQTLIYQGKADLSAAKGAAGSLLMDPDNIVVGTLADIDGTHTAVDIQTVNDLANVSNYDPLSISYITNTALNNLLTTGVSLTLAAHTSIAVNANILEQGPSTLIFNAPQFSQGSGVSIQVTNIAFSQSVTLFSDVSFIGNVAFQHMVDSDSAATPRALSITGNAIFGTAAGDFVGSVQPLASVTVGGATALNGGSVVTTVSQTYTGAVMLNSDMTLTAPAVTFASTVDGAQSLTINGGATFGGAVGGTTPLTSLSISGTTGLNGPSVSTTGGQTYSGAVTLTSDVTLTDTSASGVIFASTVDGAQALTIAGNATFDGAVGGTTPLTSLSVNRATDLNGVTVTTTGDQTYTGAVTLTSDMALTAPAVTFSSTVDGAQSLTISGGATFDGAVGGMTPLTSLSISGASTINTATIDAATSATFTGAVILDASLTLTATSAVFGSTVDGAEALTINGGATFGGAVGGMTPLTSLSVSGASTINTATIDAATSATFTGAVILDASLTLTTTSAVFGSTVDGAHFLTISGGATFGGAVGGTTPLTAISARGATDLNGSSVTTTGVQTYTAPVTLSADATLGASGVTFSSTVDGANALTIDGNVAFNGLVGATTALTMLSVQGTADLNAAIATPTAPTPVRHSPSSLTIAQYSVTTTGAQTYAGNVVLGANTALNSAGVTFDGTISYPTPAAHAFLVVNGAAEFHGAVNIPGVGLCVAGNATFVGSGDPANPLKINTGSADQLWGSYPAYCTLLFSGAVELDAGIAQFTSNLVAGGAPSLAINYARGVDMVGNIGAVGAPFGQLTFKCTSSAPADQVQIYHYGDLNIYANTLTMGSAKHWDGANLGVLGNLYIEGQTLDLGGLWAAGDITVHVDAPGTATFLAHADTYSQVLSAGNISFNQQPLGHTSLADATGPVSGVDPAGGIAVRILEDPADLIKDLDTAGSLRALVYGMHTVPYGAGQAVVSSVAPVEPVTDALTADWPLQNPTPVEDVVVFGHDKGVLQQMGIAVRDASHQELLEYLAGCAFYDDFPASLVHPSEKIAANRLLPCGVERSVELYRSLYQTVKINSEGKPVINARSGRPVMVSRHDEIKTALTEGYQSYLAASPNLKKVTALALRTYIIDRGPQTAADYLTRMPELLRALQGTGLSEYELNLAKLSLFKSVTPDAIGNWQRLHATVMAATPDRVSGAAK